MVNRNSIQLKPLIALLLIGIGLPGRALADAASRLLIAHGFQVSVYSNDVVNPRGLALSPDGVLYACLMKDGQVAALPETGKSGQCAQPRIVIDGLHHPHSLAFYQGFLYVGETDRVSRFTLSDHKLYRGEGQTVVELPAGGNHTTRTILFGPDNKLYISIGSTCNACVEDDERRATLCRCNPDGSQFEVYARGLRNAVGITFRPGTQDLWASCNGRDLIGDDLPPECFYKVEQGKNYGWPYSYTLRGKIVPDPDMGSQGVRQTGFPIFEYQAHCAPLGITFYTGTAFPEKYHDGLFVCFHGSWDRTVPVGYKVVFFPFLDKTGNKVGLGQDFLRFRLKDGEKVGRPVDVLTGPHGELFVSDDTGGRIFKVVYTGVK